LSDSVLVDAAIIAIGSIVVGLLSYYDLPEKRHKLIPQETRVSRALIGAYEYAILITGAFAGDHLGEARHAPHHLGLIAGAMVGGLLALLTRNLLRRVLPDPAAE
jgi:hypothetical protein